eukprot:gene20362-27126_t
MQKLTVRTKTPKGVGLPPRILKGNTNDQGSTWTNVGMSPLDTGPGVSMTNVGMSPLDTGRGVSMTNFSNADFGGYQGIALNSRDEFYRTEPGETACRAPTPSSKQSDQAVKDHFPGFPDVEASKTPCSTGAMSPFERWVMKTSPLVENSTPATQQQGAKDYFKSDRFNNWLMATEKASPSPSSSSPKGTAILTPIPDAAYFDQAIGEATPMTPQPTSTVSKLASELSTPPSATNQEPQPSNLNQAFNSEAATKEALEQLDVAMQTPGLSTGLSTPYENSLASGCTYVGVSDIDGAMSRLRLRMIAQADDMILSPAPFMLDPAVRRHTTEDRAGDPTPDRAEVGRRALAGNSRVQRSSPVNESPQSPVDQVLDLMACGTPPPGRTLAGGTSLLDELEAEANVEPPAFDAGPYDRRETWSDDEADLSEVEGMMMTPMTADSSHTCFRPNAHGMTPIASILALMTILDDSGAVAPHCCILRNGLLTILELWPPLLCPTKRLACGGKR